MYSFAESGGLCGISGIYQGSADLDYYLYVLQPDYVYHWILLESPDLAITEAAVGAGITSILFFVTLKKIHAIVAINEDKEDKHASRKGDAK